MMRNENSHCWYVLYTAPRSERKLMQRLAMAGYRTYCPMQTSYVSWDGKTKEVIVPLFAGCVFVEGDCSGVSSVVASQKVYFVVDAEGREISIMSDKASLLGKFAQMFGC